VLIHLFFATGRASGADCVAETNDFHDKGDEVLFVRSVGEFLEHRTLSGHTAKSIELRFSKDISNRDSLFIMTQGSTLTLFNFNRITKL